MQISMFCYRKAEMNRTLFRTYIEHSEYKVIRQSFLKRDMAWSGPIRVQKNRNPILSFLFEILQTLYLLNASKSPRQGGLLGVVQRVTRLSKFPGATKISCEQQLQASDHAPRESWPRGQWIAPGQWVVPGSCEQVLIQLNKSFKQSKLC